MVNIFYIVRLSKRKAISRQFNDSSDSLTFLKEEDENNGRIHKVDERIYQKESQLIAIIVLKISPLH